MNVDSNNIKKEALVGSKIQLAEILNKIYIENSEQFKLITEKIREVIREPNR